jgi:hypothetical protein
MSEPTAENVPLSARATAPARRLGPGVARFAAAIGGGAAFVAAAALVKPDWTRADSSPPPPATMDAATAQPTAADAPSPAAEPAAGSLGILESRDHRIEIRSTPDGPRYHLLDAEGRSLHPSGWTLEALAERFPELDLRAATASPDGGPTLLMLAPVDHHWP